MFDNRDKLEQMIGECIAASFREFGRDLERRIVIVLMDKFPRPVLLNMAKAISEDVSTYLLMEVFASGQVRELVRKML